MSTTTISLNTSRAPAAAARPNDALPERPPISAPPGLRTRAARDSEQEDAGRQPALGLAGLLLVAPVALALSIGAGSLETSLRVLGPLSTFALPVVAMIAFWWQDWPGTQLRAPLSGLLNTLLVVAGGVLFTLLGQAVVGRPSLTGVFDSTAGPGTALTFPATMPLAGAFFVVMLHVTLVNEGWPLRRLGRTASGPAALIIAWAIALSLYLVLVQTHPEPASGFYTRSAGPLTGSELGAILVAIGLWQVVFYVGFKGWPFAGVAVRAVRLGVANLSVIGAGILTYLVLRGAIGLNDATITAALGTLITAVLLHGMLFDGIPRLPEHPVRERASTIVIVAFVSGGLYAALSAIAHQRHWSAATPEQWIGYAGLNAIGLGVILHVGIGRRWPFASNTEAVPEQ